MASPLGIFRHNKKLLMAGVLVMCMISFVFIGSTSMFEREAFDPVLASTKYGYVKGSELAAFRARSSAANQFIAQLVPLTFQAMQRQGRLPAENVSMLSNLTIQQFQLAGLIVPVDENEQAMSEMLWEKKAEAMGIVVDDQAVNEFLQRLTEELVPAEEIRGVMQYMRVSERSIFYALAQRLKAVRARELLVQNASMATPATRLDWFRRTRAKATVEFLPVSIEPFVGEVPEPTDAQLMNLFEKHKLDIARPNSAEPGFYQVRRSAFAYFTARVDDFLKPDEVTDEEIAAYYEANKSFFPYTRPSARHSAPAAADTPAAEPEAAAPPDAESSADAEPPSPAGDDANAQTAPEPQTQVDGSAQDGAAQDADAQDEPEATAPAETPSASEPTTLGEAPSQTPAGEQPSTDMFAPPSEPPRYKPLDEVAGEIRELLAREMARKQIDDKQRQLASRIRYYLTERAAAISGGAPEPKPMDFEAVGREFNMPFRRTEMVTAQQLYDAHPLGQAMVEGQGIVARYAFADMAVNQPMRADGDDVQYVFWKTEDKPAYEPKFADVREQVLSTWKRIEARKLAQARAETLAETARKDGRSLADVFSQVDPKPGVAGPFGWLMRQPLAELTSSVPQWMVSPVPGVEQPGSEFMRAVFNLAVGETGVAWNAPETTAYVVRVTELAPDESVLWQEFAVTPVANYQQVAADDFARVQRRIYEELREEADLVWQDVENPRQPLGGDMPPSPLPNF